MGSGRILLPPKFLNKAVKTAVPKSTAPAKPEAQKSTTERAQDAVVNQQKAEGALTSAPSSEGAPGQNRKRIGRRGSLATGGVLGEGQGSSLLGG